MILQDLCTPLHYGAVYGHSEVISVLLAANADVNRMSEVSCMILSILYVVNRIKGQLIDCLSFYFL